MLQIKLLSNHSGLLFHSVFPFLSQLEFLNFAQSEYLEKPEHKPGLLLLSDMVMMEIKTFCSDIKIKCRY